MNTFLAWIGVGRPKFVQIDVTAKDTPVDAATPLIRASYREVLLRNVEGTPEHESAIISTYVVIPRESGTLTELSSRLVFSDV